MTEEKEIKDCYNNRCYLSGRIGGLPYLEAVNNFQKASRFVKEEMHLIPVNPINNGLQASRPWLMHMAVDVYMMLTCEKVFFLQGWEQSRGARIEHKIACLMGMEMWFEETYNE